MFRSLLAVLLALGAAVAPAAAGRSDADDARAWVRANAAIIRSVSPDLGGEDLAPLAAMIGSSRVAGFGEATHGSREFFQMKDRAFRYLVAKHGFTAFAIEANYAEGEAIDAYVKGSDGDPEALVGAMGFWTWDTEELVELVRWMRAWNENHEQKISFYGVDIQFAPSNLRLAFDFLDKAGAKDGPSRAVFADYLAAATSIGEGYRATAGYDPATGRQLRTAAESLFRYFEEHRDALVAATSVDDYERARSGALAASWYFLMEGPTADRRFTGLPLGYDVRDRGMADLVEAALHREGPDGRVFVWAHNAHVIRTRHVDDRLTMGQFLAQDLKADYVSVGFAFDHGAFQAMPPTSDATPKPKLSEMFVGPAPDDHSEALLRKGPSPIYAVDLRRLNPASGAWRWFDARRQLRWTGANYSIELMAKHPPISLRQSYDILLWVETSTRARPNAATRERQAIAKTW